MSTQITIAEQWKEYRSLAVHPEAPRHQIEELQNAFYAGFHQSLLDTFTAAAEPESEGSESLEAFFRRRLKESEDYGRAKVLKAFDQVTGDS